MRNIWPKNPTPSPVAIGQFAGNSEDGFSFFRDGQFYDAPNTLVAPATGTPVLALDFGSGQHLCLDFGGFYAQAPS